MGNGTTRFMLTIPLEMAARAEELKRDFFYDKPYAEMYRQLIRLGMEEMQKREELQKLKEKNGLNE